MFSCYVNGLSYTACYIIWAPTRENLSSEVCEQHRRRPACASAQSDQRLCSSLFGKYHIYACYKRNFKILDSLCSWGDWFALAFSKTPKTVFVASRPICKQLISGMSLVFHWHLFNVLMNWIRTCLQYGHLHEKTCLWSFRPSKIETSLLSYRD